MTAATVADLGGWPAILGPLTAGHDLTSTVASAAMGAILEGEASPAQIAAFIVGLRMKGETVDELTGLLATLRDEAEQVPLDPGTEPIDTCGTGGDKSGTVNVSSMAALICAGAGVPVVKHGNRAASSKSGSADVYEQLGIDIELGPEGVARCVREAGIGFCFARRFHPAMRHAAPVRAELGIPTVFNFLGPMANPARVRRQVLGVSDAAMAERMVQVLEALGAVRALVVYGHDGLDELTTTTTSTVFELDDGEVTTWVVDPALLGIAAAQPGDLVGGTAAENAASLQRVLGGEAGPHRDIALLNAAAGLLAAGVVDDLPQGYEAAAASVDDGKAAGALQALITTSQAAAGT
jgi:anthranilate phosphoribosyltransferase